MDEAIDLNEVIQSLETVASDISVFLDSESGDFITLTEAELQAAEELRDRADSEDLDDDMDDSMDEDMEDDLDDSPGGALGRSNAKNILDDEDGRYIALPTDRELNKWQIARDYCRTLKDSKTAAELEEMIHGSGAFIKFDNCLQRHKLSDDWNDYQRKAFKTIAIDWCDENNIKYKE